MKIYVMIKVQKFRIKVMNWRNLFCLAPCVTDTNVTSLRVNYSTTFHEAEVLNVTLVTVCQERRVIRHTTRKYINIMIKNVTE